MVFAIFWEAAMHDVVIRGGTLVDGSGAPAREADVAVDGGVVTAVGKVGGRGARELDARGLLVTPGFVDVHTHYDAQVTWDPLLTPSSWHGVTTAVMGSCGVGFAPVHADRHDWLIGLMEGVEDIPGSALAEGIKWAWETFPEYMDAVAAMPRIMDVGLCVPHGALRGYVMGDRGADNEEATAEDVARMAALVGESIEKGALGFSTSRTLLHRAIDGRPVPGTFASRDELFAIGRAMAGVGRGVFHVAPDQYRLDEEIPWMRDLAEATGITVTFNLNQNDVVPGMWRRALELLEDARGTTLYAQAAGRAIGIVMALDGTAHPLLGRASFFEIAAESLDEKRRRLADPAFVARLCADEPLDLGEFPNFITRTFSRMFLADGAIDYEPGPEKSVEALAKATGRDPMALVCEHFARGGHVYFPLFNYSGGDLNVTETLHASDRTRMGLGDAGAHCGAICDGGMPTFMLTHWARDRRRGRRFSLERMVQRQTRETAELYGLRDRGLVVPGLRADLNVIDFDRLTLTPPVMAYDLPAGGRRLLQRAKGYVATMVAGTIVSDHDEPTGALPGRLVRGGLSAA
jgi:N-acyl-D-aspartate/D-glutamate deacylase